MLYQDLNYVVQGACQRFALAACGWAWTMFGSGKNPKPEKSSKTAQTPTSPLHALLGKPDERKTRQLKKDDTANLTKFYTQLYL